jgi:hypothetical protein
VQASKFPVDVNINQRVCLWRGDNWLIQVRPSSTTLPWPPTLLS